MKSERPNKLRIVFFSEHYKETIADWQSAARLVLLKARHDYLTQGKRHLLKATLDEILERVPQATEWWDDPEIVRIGDADISFRKTPSGSRKYRLSILVSESRPDLRIAVYDPAGQ